MFQIRVLAHELCTFVTNFATATIKHVENIPSCLLEISSKLCSRHGRLQRTAISRYCWRCVNNRRLRRQISILILLSVMYITITLSFLYCDDERYSSSIDAHFFHAKRNAHKRSSKTLQNVDVCDTLLHDLNSADKLWHTQETIESEIVSSDSNNQRDLCDSPITTVTAYFPMRPYCKATFVTFDENLYRTWLVAYAKVLNPIIFYTDDIATARLFYAIRAQTPLLRSRTTICMISRTALWPFDLLPDIAAVLSRPGYPRHVPDTIRPEYGAVQHAKYALMQYALNSNPYRSKSFAWFDIGLLRLLYENNVTAYESSVDIIKLLNSASSGDLENYKRHLEGFNEFTEKELVTRGYFEAVLPKNFDTRRIAYNKPEPGSPRISCDYREYFEKGMVYVGGGIFVGAHAVLTRWVNEYENSCDFFYVPAGAQRTSKYCTPCRTKRYRNIGTRRCRYRHTSHRNSWIQYDGFTCRFSCAANICRLANPAGLI